MTKYFYIKKIIRDDGVQLAFDQYEIYLDEENTLLTRPEIATTSIDYTEADGGEMISQRLLSGIQTINGIIIPKDHSYWELREQLTTFFIPRQTYKIIYERVFDGALFQTGGCWLSENLQVPPEPRENFSKFTLSLGVGSAKLSQYAENESGEEVYAGEAEIFLESLRRGGLVWDEIGAKWDGNGAIWSQGGNNLIAVQTAMAIQPIWVVEGRVVNPTIINRKNQTTATFTGTLVEGQTLTVDFSQDTAMVDSTDMSESLSGELTLEPGVNEIVFTSDDGSTTVSVLKWNGTI